MADPNSSSDMLSYVLTACIGGIAWLFKTVFNHNKEMVNQIMVLQKDTIKTQTLTRDALIKTHNTIEALKTELTENTEIQRDILVAIKSQPTYSDPRKIIVSRDNLTATNELPNTNNRRSATTLKMKNTNIAKKKQKSEDGLGIEAI
jgi:hypothetical protein